MNTQRSFPTCELDISYCKFGAQTLLDLLDNFEKNIDGVIENSDIECVHKTRVASRRLRAALPVFKFCFPPKKFRQWEKQIKKITRLLGEARDLDTQILFLEGYQKKITSIEKPFIDLLLKDHLRRRERLQPVIVSGLDKLKSSNALTEVNAFCRQTITQQSTSPFDINQVLEKSHWHISFRIDEFLALKKYVHSPKQTIKHHEMRIAAKKLRYTMEFFAPLYNNQLNDKIEVIKKFQDILGEKHDGEVWIDYLPKFIEEAKLKKRRGSSEPDFDRSIQELLAYVEKQKGERYSQFVDLYDKSKKNRFFDDLQKASEARLTISEKRLEQTLSDKHLKIGVLSDIHANLHALKRVFADAEERGISVFINAGDSIGYGACPNEVLKLLCEKNVQSIIGNYDLEVLEDKTYSTGEKKIAWKFTKKELAKTCESYLHALPHELRFEVAGKRLLVTHGSPKSVEEHIYHDTPTKHLQTLANDANADLIIIGHSHEQFSRQINGGWFINPGSVGRPGDGNPQTGYAILSFDPLNIELVRLDYDVEDAADALRKKGLPESLSQMMLRGVSLDAINNEDKDRKDSLIEDYTNIVAASSAFADKYLPDEEHYMQVTRLALQFFDGLIKLHKLGQRERCWLECAAILHDIGLSKPGGAHHKKSAEMILNDTKLPFTSNDRRIVACIARYHRKALPKMKHYNLQALDQQTIHKIKVLASFLRAADGLDYTHESNVQELRFKIGKKVSIECTARVKSLLEEQAFNKKKDLFERVLNRKMVLTWKQP